MSHRRNLYAGVRMPTEVGVPWWSEAPSRGVAVCWWIDWLECLTRKERREWERRMGKMR